MRRLIISSCLLSLVALVYSVQAQAPAAVEPGTTYNVQLRYKIDAELQQRYALYKQMLARLEAAGFKAEPGRPGEELYGDRLAGTIPSSGLAALRVERFLRTAVLVPSNLQLPADPEKSVLVRLELTLVLGAERQKEVADQARRQLKTLNFVENEGYDNLNHTRLLGRLSGPALAVLLADSMEASLPQPQILRSDVPLKSTLIKLAIVIPEPAPPRPDVALPTPSPAGKEYLDKISPDLKAFLAKVPETDFEKLVRVEVVLRGKSLSESLKRALQYSSANFITEGSFGPIVSGLVTPSRVPALAADAAVSTVRLPQYARPFAVPARGNAGLMVDFVRLGQDLSPIVRKVSFRKPTGTEKVVIIGDDFRGYERLVGNGLPKGTHLIDVTGELRSDLTPEPLAEGAVVGQSAQVTEAYLKSHAADEVVLVRIDSSTPYQLAQVGECVLGHGWVTDALTARQEELKNEESRLEADRTDVRVLRRQVLTEFGTDETTIAKREAYRKRQAEVEAEEKAYFAKLRRLQQFFNDTQSLKYASQICVALQWKDGYVDRPGSAPTIRYLSEELLRKISWTQAIARKPGQIWTGLFRDQNKDGAMEFTVDPKVNRPDLAFLAWKPFGVGASEPNLPENAVVEVTLNWTEAHEAAFSREMKDIYRQPLANFRLSVLKQRDPSGKDLPLDAFEVVARSPVLADRVENDSRYSQYQLTARFQVSAGGRFAIRLTGTAPTSTFPTTVEPLNGEKPEIRPKITVEVIDPTHRTEGRVVFERFATPE
jgi:hypothetical protein